MSDWISVKDRLPDTPGEVLAWAKNAGIWLGYYNTRPGYQCWMKGLGERLPSITHWMPLPEPPREGL